MLLYLIFLYYLNEMAEACVICGLHKCIWSFGGET
jgi:hypothetical protein